MYNIILTIFLIVAIILISFILIHKGYGSGIGTMSSNYTNASAVFFGSHGSKNFLNLIITLLAFIFIITTLILDNLIYNTDNQWSNITPTINKINTQKVDKIII
ncbi:MAG: preprotein translocase subunit SecG [Candidatus Dasytiphilus stammeri]